MTKTPSQMVWEIVSNPRRGLADPQHREALYLAVNTLALAVGGLLFWLLLTRGLDLSSAAVGRGYAVVSMGTVVGVLAKGGFDTAIVRYAPRADRRGATRLAGTSIAIGGGVALVAAAVLAAAGHSVPMLPQLGGIGWLLVLAIGILLVVTWLLDAYFVSDRKARFTLGRNLAFTGARVGAPLLLVAFAVPHTVALAWTLGLAGSTLIGIVLVGRLSDREGEDVAIRPFLGTAVRNIPSSLATFLPGLLLTPIVLAIDGPHAAGYFGIAWTVAHLLFQLSEAIGRSALVEFAEDPFARHPAAVRRGIVQHLLLVAPAAVGAALLAPHVLGVFGAEYARLGGPPFAILCASIVVVAPWYLYLSVLRARERVVPLVLFPAGTLLAIFGLVPLLQASHGLVGVAGAWILANAPFGLWAAWRLYEEAQEVSPDDAPTIDRRPHAG